MHQDTQVASESNVRLIISSGLFFRENCYTVPRQQCDPVTRQECEQVAREECK